MDKTNIVRNQHLTRRISEFPNLNLKNVKKICKMEEIQINCYADDATIISENDVDQQRPIKQCEEMATQCNLMISVEKN